MAVRTALGAPGSRLIRMSLTKSALLSPGGAIAGLLSAILRVRALVALAPAGMIPRVAESPLDARVNVSLLGLGCHRNSVCLSACSPGDKAGVAYFPKSRRARHNRRGEALRVSGCIRNYFDDGIAHRRRPAAQEFPADARGGFWVRAKNVLTMTVDLPVAAYKEREHREGRN
jgi:hypothetical protein